MASNVAVIEVDDVGVRGPVGPSGSPGFVFEPVYTNLLFNPPVDAEKDDYLGRPPDTEPDVFNNIVIAPGYKGFPTTGTDSDFYANTFVGKGIGGMLKWSRYTDAYGENTLKWAKYTERNTILGTLGTPWLGQDLTTDETRNPDYPTVQRYYEHDILQDNGVLWTDPAWDIFGLKTQSPGVVAQISAWVAGNPWVDAKVAASPGSLPQNYVIANVVLGRDALNEKVIGSYNVAAGYRAACCNMDGSFIAAVGYEALFRNLFGSGNTALGAFAGQHNQDGGYNFYGGYRAGNGSHHGSNSVFLGISAGSVGTDPDLTVDVTISNSVFIGPFSGYGYTDATISDVLHFRNRTNRGPLIAGDFLNQQLAVGKMPVATTIFNDYRTATLLVYTGASGVTPNGSADDLFIENAGNVGITLGSPNTAGASIYFGDPESHFAGYVQYDHAANYLRFGVNALERLRVDANSVVVNKAASGITANGSADDLVIEGAGSTGITIATPNTAVASIYFADPESTLAGYVQYNHTSDYLRFGVNAGERLRLTATGIGFNGTAAVAKPSITGSRGGNAALADLLTKLASTGLITDGTTA